MTIYNITGWGKGKTTSAIGIAARALMNGEKVLFAQFLKDGNDKGIDFLKQSENFHHHTQGTVGFSKEDCSFFLYQIDVLVRNIDFDLIILDELNVALDYELFDRDTDTIIEQIKSWSRKADVYITGRLNHHELRHKMISVADVATNCYCEAHNFNRRCKECGMEFDLSYIYCPICGQRLERTENFKVGREC